MFLCPGSIAVLAEEDEILDNQGKDGATDGVDEVAEEDDDDTKVKI